jgi:hypothetical protein
MRRRSSTGGKPLKAERRKATAAKRPNAQKAARRRKSPGGAAETEVARLRRELNEALERQTATSKVLQVISSSSGELQAVFHSMLKNAARLCAAKFGALYRYEDDAFYPAAMLNAPTPYADFVWKRGRFLPQVGNPLDRLLQTKQVINIVDKTEQQVLTLLWQIYSRR